MLNITQKENSEYFSYLHWTPLFKIPMYTKLGAPDFALYKKKAEEFKDAFFPYSGNSYLTSVYTICPNLYETKLKKTLQRDSIYKLSFKCKVYADLMEVPEIEYLIRNYLGVMFVNNTLKNDESILKIEKNLVSFPVDIAIQEYKHSYNRQWFEYEATFKAKNDFSHIVVGSFKKFMEQVINPSIVNGIAWRFDEIELTSCAGCDLGNRLIFGGDKILLQSPTHKLTLDEGSQDSSVARYYQNIYRAENHILAGNYYDCIKSYAEAFRHKIPFHCDYRNAWNVVLNHKINDTLLIRQLMSGVYPLFNKKSFIEAKYKELGESNIISDKALKSILAGLDVQKYENSKDPFNRNLYNRIDSVFKADSMSRAGLSNIFKTDSFNIERLNKIFDTGIEISEQTIGINLMRMFEVVCWHLVRYKNEKLIKHLHKSVLAGHFNNRYFATLLDSYTLHNESIDLFYSPYKTNTIFITDSNFYFLRQEKAEEEKIDMERKKIYLEGIKSQVLKEFFLFRNLNNKFIFYYNVIMPESMFQKQISDRTIIKVSKARLLTRKNELSDIDF